MSISFSENAKIVLERRYLRKDSEGNLCETPEQMFERVADAVAYADTIFDAKANIRKTRDKFLKMMTSLWFLPNSPTLMNAGRELGQLAACFVLPIEDSMDAIFETLKNTAIIHKSGGGTGFSFSRIRPANDIVNSTAGVSSGPLSFMVVYDAATETVKQGATRRGANMAVLRVDHPDIEAFINAKNDLNRLNNFNISVALTKPFMEALAKKKHYQLINPRTGLTIGNISAEKIFDMIVFSAWQTGEPGVVFIDRMNESNPTPHVGMIEATNPCGEQPLLPYESCTLGSINLSRMVTGRAVDFLRLKNVVHDAVHFLDNVVEINKYPLKIIEQMSRNTRKIGLGIMGFADMLIRMNISYDSDEAVEQAEKVMSFIQKESRVASQVIGKARGNFLAYKNSIFDSPSTPFMRNATTTTIAPTGSISIIAGTSGGIEPLFAVAHVRRILDGETLFEMHPLFLEIAREQGFYTDSLAEEIASTGSIKHFSSIPEHIRNLFKTSHDIDPEWHINIQAAFQKFTDNAVSKTINFSSDTTVDDVKKAFILADKSGCKGLTIYRDGSRRDQVLSLGTEKSKIEKIIPRPRPKRTFGFTERIRTGCGNLYVTINSDETGICEVFGKMGKTGGCASSQIESVGRLISLALRSGVTIEAVIKQLIGIRCPSPAWENGKMVHSCHDAIAQVLKNVIGSNFIEKQSAMGVCPKCSGPLAHEEGCLICHSCGYSKCG
ncbi:MAG: vitamin B12-dependent ribonucleotide reductase [Desulfobacterales bacterium]